jgi:AbrB family looped-hinge helix DNA binding protein
MATSSLTSKGQLTLPISIRKKLKLKTGDQVVFTEREDGSITVEAKKSNLMDLYGSLHHPGKPFTIDEMNEAVGAHLAEDDARIIREYNEFQARGK